MSGQSGRSIEELVNQLESSQKALIQQKREHQTILDAVPAMIWYKDKSNRILSLNQAAADSLGLPKEKIKGRLTSEFYPQEAEEYFQADLEVIQTGKPKLKITEPYRLPSGELRWVSTNKFPYRDENNQIIGVIVFSSDITDQKNQEERNLRTLRYQESLLKLAKSSAGSLGEALKNILMVDARTLKVDRVSFWLFKESRSKIICQYLYQASKKTYDQGMQIEAKNFPKYFQALEESRLINAPDAQSFPQTKELIDYLIQNEIGSMLDVPVRVDGKVVGVICHEHKGDIRYWTQEDQDFATSIAEMVSTALEADQRKQVEQALLKKTQELAKSNHELEQFAYLASHDLQEPLHLIMAFGERLLETSQADLDERSRDYLKRIYRSGQRMRTLIEDLLEYSRLDKRSQPVKTVNLNQLLEELKQEFEIRIQERKAKLEIEVFPNLFGDELQLKLLFQNLISNSLKFCQSNELPSIKIRLWSERVDQIEISVEDNGIGMEANYLKRIFHPFFRLHTQGEFPGTGMGLAICKKIVERHGGKMWCDSISGKGSRFFFTLPKAKNK